MLASTVWRMGPNSAACGPISITICFAWPADELSKLCSRWTCFNMASKKRTFETRFSTQYSGPNPEALGEAVTVEMNLIDFLRPFTSKPFN